MANLQTRNLFPYAIQRTTMEEITFAYSEKSFKDDGSFELEPEYEAVKARLITLTLKDIQRLQEGGITIEKGISVSVVNELTRIPDFIIREGEEIYRVVSYTFREGVSVLVCDSLPGTI